MDRLRRLIRLARAQEGLTRMLEMRQAAQLAEVQRLQQARDELSESLDRDGAALLMAGTHGLRRLSKTADALAQAEERARQVGHELGVASRRRDQLMSRRAELEVERERQLLQVEGLEAAIALFAKASRKADMLK